MQKLLRAQKTRYKSEESAINRLCCKVSQTSAMCHQQHSKQCMVCRIPEMKSSEQKCSLGIAQADPLQVLEGSCPAEGFEQIGRTAVDPQHLST